MVIDIVDRSSQPHAFSNRQMVGWLAVFLSAFCFYFATVIIRWSEAYVAIDTSFFVFARFFLGFVVVCTTLAITGRRVRPMNYHYLLGRTVANSVAVFFFYRAVAVGSVAQANILNMTYPLFVALFSWFLIKEQRDPVALPIVGLACAGVYLVLAPGLASVEWNNLWGLGSGIMAAAAMMYLNLSRRFHDSQTILFYMFGLGSLFMLLFFHRSIHLPTAMEWYFLLSCSVAGVIGQYLLTYGFLFVTALEGSIISSGRILLAAMLGTVLVGEPALGATGWLGALLIFVANSALAWRRSVVSSMEVKPHD
jgi:drug/metabolite transporter (DMT)-like permease